MAPDPRPSLAREGDLAALLEQSLVRPDLNSSAALISLQEARQSGIAAVVVRPCDLELAVRTLEGSAVMPAGIVGYPYGFQTTAVKLYELRDLLRRGAREIEMVIGLPHLLSREFQHVQTELTQATEACRREGALLKVILPAEYLTDELKVIACGCCERAEVDFVHASTLSDIEFLRRHLPDEIALKVSGGITTLDQVLQAYQSGCSRVQPDLPSAVLSQWRQRNPPES